MDGSWGLHESARPRHLLLPVWDHIPRYNSTLNHAVAAYHCFLDAECMQANSSIESIDHVVFCRSHGCESGEQPIYSRTAVGLSSHLYTSYVCHL